MSYRELANRLEKATGPDRELDVKIALVFGTIRARDGNYLYATGNDEDMVLERDYYAIDGGPRELPYYSASLDAAIGLVRRVWPECRDGHIDPFGITPYAILIDGKRIMEEPEFKGPMYWDANGATPTLALLIALLKALEAKENSDG